MNKQHILGFFDDLVRTPVFLFLCAMFLCGAAAGGLTGLRAGEGDGAAVLSGLLAELPAHVVQSTLCALIWVLLPLVCAFLRPRELLLSAVAAARGFVLAMTVAVSVGEGSVLIIGAAGVPAVLSVSALLAACSMVWQGGEATGRYSLRTCRMPYFLCITLAVLSALLRSAIAAMCKFIQNAQMHSRDGVKHRLKVLQRVKRFRKLGVRRQELADRHNSQRR